MRKILIVVAFITVMVAVTFVLKSAATAGWVPLLLAVGAILYVGWRMEERDRRLAGEPSYSLQDAKLEIRDYVRSPTPYFLLGLLAFGLLARWAINTGLI